ncbi:hypothetical protein MKCMC460_31990 [Mycobacterium sp. 20KCMC460]|uniref:HXXEE domain-containing protein n=2 Tax=Mycobacterium TaxID=1763 RepID=A0A9P3UV83_9MYCO|nr:HXXEE domain-containing protein [Mycobacterium kiyosense]BDE14339.1 hypothetical protein MKCMC460_31990 [Mycobacterium sp. 20KCMC460]GLB81445.1 hypothetical protein SRL2020028_07010 [Mycobacterium kiyosense]GLB93638.1 hypothetical protein SRL2020226_04140 [Mycobacterium kiyosense]GLD28454.1 hypothetical protein Mkiyose1413_03370 [Mycobacterium kiyosense]GLD34400.1 hypothetical protein Mkiyose1595_06200 [Mycobacterium kiyosense]
MDIGAAAFWVMALFVVHEFEEIIRIRPWIDRHRDDPRFAQDIWIRRQASYPSTEAIAVMIGEEIILFCLVLAAAVWAGVLAVIIALATLNSIHLVGHLVFAARVKAWNPGSSTAAITLVLNMVVIVYAYISGLNVGLWGTATIVLGAGFAANLWQLHRHAAAIQRLLFTR